MHDSHVLFHLIKMFLMKYHDEDKTSNAVRVALLKVVACVLMVINLRYYFLPFKFSFAIHNFSHPYFWFCVLRFVMPFLLLVKFHEHKSGFFQLNHFLYIHFVTAVTYFSC